jgi:hypothetical protein
VQRAKHASVHAVIAAAKKINPYELKYGKNNLQSLLHVAAGAKQRCTNANAISFSNYGGRGIEFKFPTVRSFAEWVLDNLGVRPTDKHSIDRIDNNGHYEAGNLRWATRSEQASNKRAYKRTDNGERIKRIKGQRPDLTYETIRLWIIQGATDDEMLRRRKYVSTSV